MSDSQRDLIIDEQFQRLIRPLSSEEYKLLEENILRDGCREPLTIWQGIILDGHNRYKICKHWNLPFTTTELQVPGRDEAMSWICTNQLGRRNLSEEMRRYLIGKRYDIEKQIQYRNDLPIQEPTKKPSSSENKLYDADGHLLNFRVRRKNPTAERLGEEYHITHGTVQRYSQYSRAVDTIADVSPDLAPQILNGSLKVPLDKLIALSKLDAMNMHRYVRKLQSPQDESNLRYIDTRRRLSELAIPPPHTPVNSTKPRPAQVPIHTGIKNMPEYNPDAEVTGLTLTIPSWGSSIHRVLNQIDLQKITPHARDKLIIALSNLQEVIESLLNALRE